jgi:hypothetical protein
MAFASPEGKNNSMNTSSTVFSTFLTNVNKSFHKAVNKYDKRL